MEILTLYDLRRVVCCYLCKLVLHIACAVYQDVDSRQLPILIQRKAAFLLIISVRVPWYALPS